MKTCCGLNNSFCNNSFSWQTAATEARPALAMAKLTAPDTRPLAAGARPALAVAKLTAPDAWLVAAEARPPLAVAKPTAPEARLVAALAILITTVSVDDRYNR